ncbi:MAG TPA: molecular chaperone DnaK [Ktedonobacterales bacterium]|nr:molecular chaperone DnaK [Ktedonobacterales bacterium]
MPKVVGIDLGTTNSVVAVMEHGNPIVIPNADGSRTTPSVVAFSKTGERLVGQIARRQAVLNPEHTVRSIKRQMGTHERVKSGGRQYSPQEISAMILQKLKADAEAYVGEPVTKAVITVPAYFNDAQRQATKDAGKIAGLEVLRILNEPTAASLAYGLESKKTETILVWDLGGGTFDVSVLEVGEGVFEVKSTNGDTHLGGDDYDQRIVEWIATQFRQEQGIDLRQDRQALQRLLEAAEKAKIELSTIYRTNINLPFITADANGPKHLDITLSRATFEDITADLTERTVAPFRAALSDARLDPQQLDEVVLVGGATRMPAIQQLVRHLTGKEARQGVNPDEVVALGAAIQAAVLTGEVRDVVLLDVTPLSLGVETIGGLMTTLIERNTTIPTRKMEVFTTGEDNQSSVEVHVLQGERKLARDNQTLGRFHLEGIQPAPRGRPQVEVTFDIDANGIVSVSARERATGREQRVTITASAHLSKEEVNRLVSEAARYAEEDRRRRDEAELRNHAQALLYYVERTWRDLGERIPAQIRADVERAEARLRLAMDGASPEGIRLATADLKDTIKQIGQAIYSSASSSGSAPHRQGPGSPATQPKREHDSAIDAEFREM